MSLGLPKFNNPLDALTGAGVNNGTTRDLSVPNVVKAAIVPINEAFNRENVLLVNPNSVNEQKAANWVKHYIPGQSDPLLQWVSGGERVISFTAMVTKDIASNPTVNKVDNGSIWELIITPELQARADTAETFNAAQLAALSPDTPVNAAEPAAQRDPAWSRSIQPQLDFYRKLVVPREGTAGFHKTPPLVRLEMGTILGGFADVQNQQFILLNYTMQITEFSPQLEPMKATVTFSFVEYVPKSKSNPAQTDQDTAIRTSPRIDNSTGVAIAQRGIQA